jgi:hypothetical protein
MPGEYDEPMMRVRRVAPLLVALLLAPAARPGAQERTATVSTAATLTVLSGRVEHARAGSDRSGAAASGTDLAVGDRIVTSPGARALITFLDGSTVTVEPASDVMVRQAEIEGRDASRLRVLITVGTVWARVAGWLGGRATLTLESNAYSATAHDGLIGAPQQPNGSFVCWTRAGALEVAEPGGAPPTTLQPGQKATLAPGRPAVTEGFAVNQSTLEVVTSGPVLPLVAMPDGVRLAGFVEPGIEVNQVFGSLTAARAGAAHSVEIPAGLSGPYVLLLTAVGAGPFTVTVVGRHQGAVTYRHEHADTARRGQRLRAEIIQMLTGQMLGGPADPRTARAGSAGMSALRPETARPGTVLLSPLELAAPRP